MHVTLAEMQVPRHNTLGLHSGCLSGCVNPRARNNAKRYSTESIRYLHRLRIYQTILDPYKLNETQNEIANIAHSPVLVDSFALQSWENSCCHKYYAYLTKILSMECSVVKWT